jgi:hypothetical protein
MSKEDQQIQATCTVPRISLRPPKATEAGGKVTTICPYCHEKVSNALFEIFVINTGFPASGSNVATSPGPVTSSELKPTVFAFGGSGQDPACLIGRGIPW